MASTLAVAETAVREPRIRVRGRNSLLWMVLAGLALRLVVMMFLYPERTDPFRDHWRFAGEAGRIASSIAQGEGFSNPLFAKTGPTAMAGAVFPYLLAGIFKDMWGLFQGFGDCGACVGLHFFCDQLHSGLLHRA